MFEPWKNKNPCRMVRERTYLKGNYQGDLPGANPPGKCHFDHTKTCDASCPEWEGEFKRQIYDQFGWLADEDFSIIKIVGVADKEFPVFHGDETNVKDLWAFLTEIHDWKRKWFPTVNEDTKKGGLKGEKQKD